MCARMGACAALAAAAVLAVFAQDAQIILDVRADHAELNLPEETERQKLSDLAKELDDVKGDIMLMYTEYTAKAGHDLKEFLMGISEYAAEAVGSVAGKPDVDDHGDCRGLFEICMRKIKLDAYRAASFSGENHHKFLLGHMVVFRMHINKTNEYLKKCDMALQSCGAICDANPKIKRWKRLAAGEMHRIRDDIKYTRRSYKDLVVHARRRLHRLKKHLTEEAANAALNYHACLVNTTIG